MSEIRGPMRGLAAIVADAEERGVTLHSIAEPPEMSDPPTEAEQKAYDEWWVRTHCWTATVTRP